jgi:hypothetical protein
MNNSVTKKNAEKLKIYLAAQAVIAAKKTKKKK